MPTHGLEFDLELAGLFASAIVFSYFLTGNIVSQVLITVLLGLLFFLEGMHFNTDIFSKFKHRKAELGMVLWSVYVFSPAIAFIFGELFSPFQSSLLILGVSASALTAPKIWANMCDSDGELASLGSSLTLLISPVAIPLLLAWMPIEFDFSLLVRNSFIAILPFMAGFSLRNVQKFGIQDFKFHFSKAAFWLLVVITSLQIQLLDNFQFLGFYFEAAIVFFLFIVANFGYSYIMGKEFDRFEKEALSLGLLSGSKNIAVALFLAAQFNGQAVAFVGVYYFVRQFTGWMLADVFKNEEFSRLEQLVENR